MGSVQVAKFFISKSCYRVKNNKKIVINGNGDQLEGLIAMLLIQQNIFIYV